MTNPGLLFAEAIDRLKTTVHEGRSFDAAQVRVVGLDDIRAAAGDKWGLMKERVRSNSLDFLKGCLGHEDIVIPAGDGFLVLYAESSTRDLARESETIQDALNAFYIGEEGMERLRAKVRGVSVDANNMGSVLAYDGSDLAEVEPGPAPLQLQFTPVWSVAPQAIGAYFVSARGGEPPAASPEASADEIRRADDARLHIDLEALAKADASVEATLSGAGKCLIGFSVHATTMRNRTRRGIFLAKLAATPERVRKYMPIKIAAIEAGVPIMTLTEWVGAVRGVCPRVTLDLSPDEPALRGLEVTGAWAVSCRLPAHEQATPEQCRKWATLIGRWAAALARQKLKFAVDDVCDPLLFEIALRAGVDFITSEVVWPSLAAPGGVVAVSRANAAATFARRRAA